jgi:hypothetical protein
MSMARSTITLSAALETQAIYLVPHEEAGRRRHRTFVLSLLAQTQRAVDRRLAFGGRHAMTQI